MTTGESPSRWLNPLTYPKTKRAKALVEAVLREVQETEARLRKRKARDQKVLREIVGAVLGEALGGGCISIALDRARKTPKRYRDSVAASEMLSGSLRRLDALGWIAYRAGHWGTQEAPQARKEASMFTLGERLREEAERLGVVVGDFSTLHHPEVIFLSRSKAERKGVPTLLPYEDTRETRRMRKEVQAINRWLERAALQSTLMGVSTDNRHLVRRFTNGRFDHGGHLFGGFWQNVAVEDRRRHFTIAGSTVAHVDYSSAYCRLAYAMVGAVPPTGDLYVVPGLEGYREAVKTWMAAMFFPRGLGEDVNGKPLRAPLGARKGMPPGMASEEFHRLVQAHHEPIAHLFGTDVGYVLMHQTSECTLRAMLRLMGELPAGVAVLPVFDALVCRLEDTDRVAGAMVEAFREVSGADFGKVGIK